MQGFPERIVYSYKLDKPEAYEPEQLAHPQPEHKSDDWLEFDPRLSWLENFLKTHPNDKALLITARADTALAIAQHLRVKRNIHAAVFHEGMTILERDRAAAFFADNEDGSQILLCSEIGGEGRNFQFASHLILFDIPENPDRLEQRIGRIDRIGQGDEIFIHVPYIEGSAQEVLYRWYYEALEALQETCPAAATVYQQYGQNLREAFAHHNKLDELINLGKEKTKAINQQLHDGRDKLLELNSFQPELAEDLRSSLENAPEQTSLEEYMSLVFDCFGVDKQVHSDQAYVLQPSTAMLEPFPGLPDDGTTVTFDRETALKYEDMQFLSWEHEMVTTIMEYILIGEKGNAGISTFQHPAVPANTLMLECLFVLDVKKEVRAYLPNSIVRTVISEDKKNYGKLLSAEVLAESEENVKGKVAKQIVKSKEKALDFLIRLSQGLADKQAHALAEEAATNAKTILNAELERLLSLQKINPNVRDEEINFFKEKLEHVTEALASPALRLDAVRVLIAI